LLEAANDLSALGAACRGVMGGVPVLISKITNRAALVTVPITAARFMADWP
jgi:hypothetical protein